MATEGVPTCFPFTAARPWFWSRGGSVLIRSRRRWFCQNPLCGLAKVIGQVQRLRRGQREVDVERGRRARDERAQVGTFGCEVQQQGDGGLRDGADLVADQRVHLDVGHGVRPFGGGAT